MGPSLNTLHGSEHRERRKLLQPAYSRARIERLSPAISRRVDAATAGIRPGDRLPLRELLDPLSLSIVGEVLLGVDLDDEAEIVASEARTVVSSAARLTPPLSMTAHGKAKASLERRIDTWIADHPQSDLRQEDDVISILTASGLDRETIRGEILSTLNPAVDEPTSAMEGLWWLLDRNPQHDLRLAAELKGLSGPGPVDPARVEDLPWLRAVVDESLRLSPPTRFVDRCPASRGVTLAGRSLRSDTNLLISPLVTQRDPSLFDDPDGFDPERMLEPKPAESAPKGSFIPFGAGVHTCIGQSLARAIINITVASISRRWRLRVDPDAPLPDPRTPAYEVTFERRDGPDA